MITGRVIKTGNTHIVGRVEVRSGGIHGLIADIGGSWKSQVSHSVLLQVQESTTYGNR